LCGFAAAGSTKGAVEARFVRPDVTDDRVEIVLKALHVLSALLVELFYNRIDASHSFGILPQLHQAGAFPKCLEVRAW
jgi:hypothetical protein